MPLRQLLTTGLPNRGTSAVPLRAHESVLHLFLVRDPLAAMVEDALDSERAILIGQSEKGRVLLVVFIEQSEDTIHIISARRATSHERKRYEEGGW